MEAMNTQEIKQNLVKEFGLNPKTVYVFNSFDKEENNQGTFALIYNFEQKSNTIFTDKQIKEFEGLKGDDFINVYYKKFMNRREFINDDITNEYIRDRENINIHTVEKILSKNKNTNVKKDELDFTVLKGNGCISGFKINNDGSLGDRVFSSSIKVERTNNKTSAKRCFVNEVETDEDYRGKGLAGHMLSTFLPRLCANDFIEGIVLQASAFDIKDGRGTQEQLEKFYKKCGFTKLEQDEDNNFVSSEDFDQGMPVFVKTVNQNLGFDL